MTEKLGVLLVDVPEPKYWKYHYLEYSYGTYDVLRTDEKELVESQVMFCTQEEAKKYQKSRIGGGQINDRKIRCVTS